jgi:outer membrane protein
MSRHFDRIRVGAFIRYDYLSGAAFDDSPLVETDHSLMGGVAVSWILKKSTRTVTR